MKFLLHASLWTVLPLSFCLFWQLLGRIGIWASPYRRLVLSAPLAAAALVYFTALTAPLTHQLAASLGIAALFALFLNVVLWKTAKPSAPTTWTFRFTWTHFALILWGSITTLLVAVVAVKFAFHDQIAIQGHCTVIESILRGNFPPRLMIFPDLPLKYHYGVDLLSAIFAYLTGLPGYRAIDITQIFGWIMTISCLYVFCREIGLRRGYAFLATNWILFGAGWVYLLKYHLDFPPNTAPFDYNWPDVYTVFKHYLNPGVLSYFFQAPYCLGLPVFFSYLVLLQRWLREKKTPIFLFAVGVLGSLSLIQVMLFTTTLGATLVILVGQVLFEKASLFQAFKRTALLLAVTVTMVFLIGGIFDRSEGYARGLIVFHWPPGYLRFAVTAGVMELNFGQSFLWYLSTFGSLCLLGIPAVLWGLASLRKNYQPWTLFFLSFAVASFALPQFFYYRASWDIIKWFTGYQIATSFLILWLLSNGKTWRRYLWIALLPLIVLDVIPSYRFLYGLGFAKSETLKGRQRSWLRAVIKEPSPSYRFFVDKFRAGPWNELVFSPYDISTALAPYSGQAMATIDHNTGTFGPKPEITQARNFLLKEIQTAFSVDLMQQGKIRYLVFPCDRFAQTFSPQSVEAVQAAVGEGKLEEIAVPSQLGCWKFYRRP